MVTLPHNVHTLTTMQVRQGIVEAATVLGAIYTVISYHQDKAPEQPQTPSQSQPSKNSGTQLYPSPKNHSLGAQLDGLEVRCQIDTECGWPIATIILENCGKAPINFSHLKFSVSGIDEKSSRPKTLNTTVPLKSWVEAPEFFRKTIIGTNRLSKNSVLLPPESGFIFQISSLFDLKPEDVTSENGEIGLTPGRIPLSKVLSTLRHAIWDKSFEEQEVNSKQPHINFVKLVDDFGFGYQIEGLEEALNLLVRSDLQMRKKIHSEGPSISHEILRHRMEKLWNFDSDEGAWLKMLQQLRKSS